MTLISQEATKPAVAGSRSWKGSPRIRVWGIGMLSQGAVGPKGLVVCAKEFPRVQVGCYQCLELKGSF